MAMCDAKTLYEAMESGNSVDWKTIMSLISERNNEQIKAILISCHEFSKFLKCNKFGKEVRIVIGGIQNPAKFLAKQLRGGAWQSSDVREVLTRLVITRLAIDIKDINNIKTGLSLENLVKREFSGDKNADKAHGLVGEFLLGLLEHC